MVLANAVPNVITISNWDCIINNNNNNNNNNNKRGVSEDWKDAKSKVKMCRVCNVGEKKSKDGKEAKTTWICKDVLEILDCVLKKTVLRCTTQNLTSDRERTKTLVI